MKYIKNYVLALVILSLSINTLPFRGRGAALAIGVSAGRHHSNDSYESNHTRDKQIKRHEKEIAEHRRDLKKLSSNKKLDEPTRQQRKQEHETEIQKLEAMIQDLLKL